MRVHINKLYRKDAWCISGNYESQFDMQQLT